MVEQIIQLTKNNLKTVWDIGNQPVGRIVKNIEHQLRWLVWEVLEDEPSKPNAPINLHSPVRVCLYLEVAEYLDKSGFKTAFRHHTKALRGTKLEILTNPEAENYDILHLHAFGPMSLYYMRRARLLGKTVIAHAHSIGAYDLRDSFTMSNAVSPLYERYLRFFYQAADALCTPTRFARDSLIAQGITTPIFVVSNGIDCERFRKRAAYTNSTFTVFSAGNVIPRKGVDDFIATAKKLPDYRFVWYGQLWPKLFTLFPSLLKAIKQKPSNVIFPGFTNKPYKDYSVPDVLLFPSRTETQGLVILEAAALGKPLIVRDIPEYEDWLTDGVNCIKAKSVDEFAQAIQKLANDHELYERLSREAHKLSRNHALPLIGAQLQAMYEMVAKSQGTFNQNCFTSSSSNQSI